MEHMPSSLYAPILIDKTCENPNCHKTWRQLESSNQKFHSKFCEEDWNRIKNQLPRIEKKDGRLGARPKKPTLKEEKMIPNTNENYPSDIENTITAEKMSIPLEIDIEKIPSTQSTEFLSDLVQEKSSSVMQLNNVANSLLKQALLNPGDALSYMIEFRNVMKTKLEFMKFGRDLMRGK